MAAADYASISGALNLIFEDKIASQINRASVALQVLPKKRMRGKSVAWDARVGTTTGAAIADGTTVSTFNVDTKVPAVLQYATYHDAFGLTGRAMAAAVNAGGPKELENLLEEMVGESTERIATILNSEIYTGTGGSAPETIAGLISEAIVASSTYAGIASATYPQWAGNVLANSSVPRALSVQLMRDMRRTIYLASGKKPKLVLAHPAQFEEYGNLLGTNRRFMQDVNIGGAKITLDGGFQALDFDGIPVIEDKDCTQGSMVFIDTSEVAVIPLPDATQQMAGGTNGEIEIAGTEEEQGMSGPVGINARIQPLAVNGDVRDFALFVYVQLQVRRPNACGVLTDLS
jgi:hypothetical protein